MRELSVGGRRYLLVARQGENQWTAHAEREETRQRFGIECVGPTKDEAISRVIRWIEWQDAHAAALEALQGAERAYHRTLANSAFGNTADGSTLSELQTASLDAVDAARVRLDHIRSQMPDGVEP